MNTCATRARAIFLQYYSTWRDWRKKYNMHRQISLVTLLLRQVKGMHTPGWLPTATYLQTIHSWKGKKKSFKTSWWRGRKDRHGWRSVSHVFTVLQRFQSLQSLQIQISIVFTIQSNTDEKKDGNDSHSGWDLSDLLLCFPGLSLSLFSQCFGSIYVLISLIKMKFGMPMSVSFTCRF